MTDAEVIINQFINGASIEAAAAVYSNIETPTIDLVMALIASALTARKVIIQNNLQAVMISAGFSVGGELNFSLARIAGNMILEANDTKYLAGLTKKIGGRSMMSATKLTGKAKEIFDEQAANGLFDDVEEYRDVFVLDNDIMNLINN